MKYTQHFFILSLLLSTTHDSRALSMPTWLKNITLTKALLIGGGAVGTGFLGKWAYDYFFAPSDYEVIEKATVLCLTAHENQKIFAGQYAHEIELLAATSERGEIEKELIDTIKNSGGHRPFLRYARNLVSHYNTLKSHQKKLINQKINIMKRRLKVVTNENLPVGEQQRFVTQYNELEKELTELISAVQHIMLQASTIKRYVINLSDYKHEYALERVERLEQEVAFQRMDNWMGHHHHCSRPTHVHNTNTTVVNNTAQPVVQDTTPAPTTHGGSESAPAAPAEPSSAPTPESTSTAQPVAAQETTSSDSTWSSKSDEEWFEQFSMHSNLPF